MKYFDTSPNILSWSSEETIIPYLYEVDKSWHRYFIDFKIQWKDKSTTLIEVKPNKETQPPKKINTRGKRYINEALTYVKNVNKWKAAEQFAKDRGWKFEIWTEVELKSKGIMPKSTRPLKKLKPYRKTK